MVIFSQVMWWDARKLSEPTEVLILDLSKNESVDEPEWLKWARSHGVSCMDYDPSIPIRFMVCITVPIDNIGHIS